MEYKIETIGQEKLIGKRMKMSFSNNKTPELWKSFMLMRKEIQSTLNTDLCSMQIYPPDFFNDFNPNAEFEKWAAVKVKNFDSVPHEMEAFLLPGGLYAVFKFKGRASEGAKVFQYILGTWLPNSEYKLDARPHFEILGEKYRNEDPESEEEIWIPVMNK